MQEALQRYTHGCGGMNGMSIIWLLITIGARLLHMIFEYTMKVVCWNIENALPHLAALPAPVEELGAMVNEGEGARNGYPLPDRLPPPAV